MKKKCAKCLSEFECKADDIKNCDCNKVVLTPEIKTFLQTNYDNCLCNNCLLQFENLNI